jgi:hypothetical protein
MGVCMLDGKEMGLITMVLTSLGVIALVALWTDVMDAIANEDVTVTVVTTAMVAGVAVEVTTVTVEAMVVDPVVVDIDVVVVVIVVNVDSDYLAIKSKSPLSPS